MKHKKLLAILTLVCFMFTLVPVAAFAEETSTVSVWDGSSVDTDWYTNNTTASAYNITSAAQLAGLAKLVNEGNAFTGETISLAANIDLNNQVWTPIGTKGNPFNGNFDGCEYTISNLYISDATASHIGLFGKIGTSAEGADNKVKDLTIENINLYGNTYVGGIVGDAFVVDFENCHVTGSISIKADDDSHNYFGGIAGAFYGSATNCTVIDTTNDGGEIYGCYSGGIFGWCGEGSTTITGCEVKNITLGLASGGIVGLVHYGNIINGNTVENCVVNLSDYGTRYSGLIAGDNRANSTSPNWIVNNNIINTTGVTNIVPSNENTFVGIDVEFDSDDKIIAGTFTAYSDDIKYSTNIASLIAEGKVVTENEDGTYTVSDPAPVASVNGNDYYTFAEAVAALESTGTIKLLADTKLDAKVTIAEGKNITLDLNGKNITVTKDESTAKSLYAFYNAGTLTLEDSVGTGSITARGIENYGTMTMNGGTIIACDTNGGYGIWNYGDFTMNGGTMKVTHVGAYSDTYGPTGLGNMAGATMTIVGGNIESVNVRSYVVASQGELTIAPAEGKEVKLEARRGVEIGGGTAVIDGGTFEVYFDQYVDGVQIAPESYLALYVYGGESVTVNGGTFTAPDQSVWSAAESTPIVINDGYFSSLTGKGDYYAAKNLTIYGGTFEENPSAFVASGYAAVEKDGVWTIVVPATSVTLDKTAATVNINETLTLKATVAPENTTDAVTWTSSDASVAAVDSNGKVTPVAAGTATITATAGAVSATCEVTVVVSAIGVTLDKAVATVSVDETLTLTAAVTPTNTTDAITWTSSDTTVATVVNGVVTGVKVGKATITVTVGSVNATCEITVENDAALDATDVAKDDETGKVTTEISGTFNKNQDTETDSTLENITPEKVTVNVTTEEDTEATAVVTVTETAATSIGNGNAVLEIAADAATVILDSNALTAIGTATAASTETVVATIAVAKAPQASATVSGKVVTSVAAVDVDVMVGDDNVLPEGNNTGATVTITVPIDPVVMPNGSVAYVYHVDGSTMNFVKQTTVASNAVTFGTNHLSTYAIFSEPAVQVASSSGGGFSGSYNYLVNDPEVSNGKATLSESNAIKGETVVVTATPDNGYGVYEVIVTDKDGNVIPTTDNNDGTYSFVMPAGGVDVQVVCKPAITLVINDLYINVFGKTFKNDVAPIIAEGNRTMLPIRAIAENLGADVDWDPATQKVTITTEDTVIEIFIGKTVAYINGEAVQLDTAAFIDNNRTYLQVRFVSEALNADVNWNAETRTVTIIPE